MGKGDRSCVYAVQLYSTIFQGDRSYKVCQLYNYGDRHGYGFCTFQPFWFAFSSLFYRIGYVFHCWGIRDFYVGCGIPMSESSAPPVGYSQYSSQQRDLIWVRLCFQETLFCFQLYFIFNSILFSILFYFQCDWSYNVCQLYNYGETSAYVFHPISYRHGYGFCTFQPFWLAFSTLFYRIGYVFHFWGIRDFYFGCGIPMSYYQVAPLLPWDIASILGSKEIWFECDFVFKKLYFVFNFILFSTLFCFQGLIF